MNLHYTYFDAYEDGGFEFGLTAEDAKYAHHSGDCEPEVDELMELYYIKDQFAELKNSQLVNALRGYGAWEDHELDDRRWNEKRIVWLAACDISEELFLAEG